MPFDVQAARSAGSSDAEIAEEMAKGYKFDIAAARAAGYSDAEIIDELQPKAPPATALDRTYALANGVNSGFANVVGLPVDTFANVVDLGKAAIGYPYSKLTGKAVPEALQPSDRKQYVLSSDYIKEKLNQVGIGTSTPRQDDKASRYLATAGNIGAGAYFGGIYNKLPLPGAPPQLGANLDAPLGGRPNVQPGGPAPVGGPIGGVEPAPGSLGNFRPGTPNHPTPLAESIPPGYPGSPQYRPIGLNATEQATLGKAEALGLKATPGAAAGSPQLRQIEASLESFPSTSGPFNTLKAANSKVISREFLKAIGESGDEVSSNALANAAERIGKVFDDAAANTKVAYDDVLESRLAEIGQRAATELTEAEAPVIQRQLSEVLNKAAQTGGTVDGKAFQNIYSAVGRLQKNGNGATKDLAGDIRDALHDALIRSSGKEVANKLTTARDQYRVLLTAEKSGAIDPGSGTLRAGQLAGAFSRADKNGYLRGNRDNGLYDALKFANTRTFGPIVGDSGTATRAGIQGLFDVAKYAGGNAVSKAYLSPTGNAVAKGGVKASNATSDVVRSMLGIPETNPVGTAAGLAAAQEELRKGLLRQ